MNKVDMIATMAEVSGLSKKDCEAALFLRLDRKIEKFLENTLPNGTPYSE